MRHKVKGRKLGRTTSHRKATLQSLSIALIHERRIRTTVAKAKELRTFIEPLITRAKEDSMHNRREVFSRLQDKYAVTELFEEVGPKCKDRPGGYTRVVKLGFRVGDAAELALIELVDYNDVKPDQKQDSKKRTRRAGRAKSSTADESVKTTTESLSETKPAESSVEVDESAVQTSADFTVDQVKERIQSMNREEATAFASADERVTVKKALEKRLVSLDGDQSA